jgi:predicted molibdopterin-dependent oxidoreductase YjgC
MAATLTGGLEVHSDLFLDVEPGTEHVLLHGLATKILERTGRPPSADTVAGFEEWQRSVEIYTSDVVAGITGIAPEQLDALTALMLEAERCVVVVVAGLGIPGDEAAVVRAAGQALEVRGGPGGIMILGEKVNVQGVVDVGMVAGRLPGGRSVGDEDDRRTVGECWRSTAGLGRGWDASEAFTRSAAGEVGALYLVGQDPVGCWPQLYGARDALAGAGFVVVQDAFLHDTARHADVVLPVALLAERAGSVVGLDGCRRALVRSAEPPAGLPQDGHLMIELARRLGSELPTGETLESEMRQLVSWPSRGGRFSRWNPAAQPMAPPTRTGFLLDTSPQLFHSGSVTFHSRQLQDLSPTIAVRLNPDDALEIGVHSGEVVALEAGGRERLLRARIDRTVRRGTVVVPWQGGPDGGAVLMECSREPMSVRIRRSH